MIEIDSSNNNVTCLIVSQFTVLHDVQEVRVAEKASITIVIESTRKWRQNSAKISCIDWPEAVRIVNNNSQFGQYTFNISVVNKDWDVILICKIFTEDNRNTRRINSTFQSTSTVWKTFDFLKSKLKRTSTLLLDDNWDLPNPMLRWAIPIDGLKDVTSVHIVMKNAATNM